MRKDILILVIAVAAVLGYGILATSHSYNASFERLEGIGEIELNADTIWYISTGAVTPSELRYLRNLSNDYTIVVYSDLD